MQHAAGEFALQQPVAVGLLHGGGEQLALDQPPVDEEQLPSPCAVTGGGAGDEAGDKMATAYAKSFAEKILKDTSMKQSFADAMGINVNELNIDNLIQ